MASLPYSRLNDSFSVFAGSLPGFRIGQKPDAEPVGHRGAEDEPPALDADDERDALVLVRRGDGVDGRP